MEQMLEAIFSVQRRPLRHAAKRAVSWPFRAKCAAGSGSPYSAAGSEDGELGDLTLKL